MNLTEKQIIKILENNLIKNCSKSEKSQVFKAILETKHKQRPKLL